MEYGYSPRLRVLQERLAAFMESHIYPAESHIHQEIAVHRNAGNPWRVSEVMDGLKSAARAGLWNLFLPGSTHGAGLSNLDYALLCEIMGRSPLAPEACNGLDKVHREQIGKLELDRYRTRR